MLPKSTVSAPSSVSTPSRTGEFEVHQTSSNHRRIDMTKKPSRVRVLMMPYHDDGDKDPVGYSGPATVLTGLPRTSCGSSCRSPKAPFTRWRSAANSLAASISHRDASCGTLKRSKHGWSSAARLTSRGARRSRRGPTSIGARSARLNGPTTGRSETEDHRVGTGAMAHSSRRQAT